MTKFLLTFASFILGLVCSYGQVSKTISVSQAGSLSTLLGDNKTKVTDLTLTGTINATDFTAIKQMTALKNLDMSQVKIDNNTIPAQAFRDRALNSFTLPESLEVIGESAFQGSTILSGLILPSNVKTIQDYAFQWMQSPIDFSASKTSLQTLGMCAFNGYTGLKELDFHDYPNFVKYKSYSTQGAFTGYSGHVILPSNMESLPAGTFTRFYGTVTLPSGLKSIGELGFGECNMSTLTLPESLAVIGESAFRGSTIVSGLKLPSKVTTIQDYAFQSMKSAIDFSASKTSLESLGMFAFNAYTGLTELDFHDYSNFVKYKSYSTQGAFSGYTGHVILPSNMESLPAATFARFSGTVTLPSGLKSIGQFGFETCNMSTLTLPESLAVIGESAFRGSTIVSGLKLPSKVTTIQDYAFQSMKSAIDFSASKTSLESLGMFAFNAYTGLTELDFHDYSNFVKYKSYSTQGAFSGYTGHVILPSNMESLPAATFARFSGTVTLPSGLKSIGQFGFETCNMSTLTLPESLAVIGESAFRGSTIVSGLKLPSKVTTIQDYAFQSMKSAIDFSASKTSLESLGMFAFNAYTGLTELDFHDYSNFVKYKSYSTQGAFSGYTGHVILPSNMESLPAATFARFSGTVTLPSGLKSIGQFGFETCNMSTLTLPESLAVIGESAFRGSTIVSGLKLPSKVTTIQDYAFQSMKSAIDFSASKTSLQTLGMCAFNGYTGLKELDFHDYPNFVNYPTYSTQGAFTGYSGHVILPSNMESLPAGTFTIFYGTATLPSVLKSIGLNAFNGSTIKKIDLPSTVTSIGASAFYNCTALDTIISRNGIPPTLGANVFLNVNKETTQLIVPESSINLYGTAAQWKDFLNVKPTLPSQLSLLYRIGKTNINSGDNGGTNSYAEGAIEANYEAVRIGEYYWMNTNFNHVEPFRKWWASTVSGDEVHFPLTQSVIDKYLGIIGIDKSQYQIDIDQFTKDFGVYYSSYSRTYMSTWGKIYEDNSSENNPSWNLPSIVDYRQLIGMSDFRHYIAKTDTLKSRDVLYTLAAQRNTNEMSQYVLTTGCLDHTGQSYTTTDWYGLNGVTNKYDFSLMQGGARFNRIASEVNQEWYTANCEGGALTVEWTQTGDLYHHLYTTELAARDGFFNLHDFVDTNPGISYHWQHTRWCRALTDEELGYKLYINIPNLDKSSNEWKSLTSGNEIPLLIKYRYSDLDRNAVSIIKLGLNENAPEGYIDLPKGYIRGFYVNLGLDKVSSEVDFGRIISLACQVDDKILMKNPPKDVIPGANDSERVSSESDTRSVVSIPYRAESSVSVYPNPATDVLNVSGEGVENVSVYDMSGRQVATANSNTVSVSDLNTGTYVVKVKTTTGESTHKVMKK